MEHVVFYALIGDEAGEFDMADVCNREADKLMFRHPFIDWNNSQGDWTIDNEPFSVSATDMTINAKGQVVYKDSEAGGSQDADKPKTAAGVEQTWEQIKQRERDGNTSVLSGVPSALPSLIKAYRIQDKARNVGFDWQKKEDVWDKVKDASIISTPTTHWSTPTASSSHASDISNRKPKSRVRASRT